MASRNIRKMSQDIISDVLNMIMNAKRARKKELETERRSKLLIEVLDIMKKHKYIDYKKGDKLKIEFEKLNEARAIKPRFTVKANGLDKYIRRYLPSRNYGIIIISTSKGLMTNEEAEKKNLGGVLIAYCY